MSEVNRNRGRLRKLLRLEQSDSPSLGGAFRSAATTIDNILKGRKPADLPVVQPMKFELVISLIAADQIGLTIPQWPLMKADRVIR